VALWARDEAKSRAAIAQLERIAPDHHERPAIAVACDVADAASVAAALDQTVAALGRVDACIANAGMQQAKPVLELTLEDWRALMAVNLDGVFLTLQAAARKMVDQGEGGALVAVSSTSAFHGAPMNAHYAASKAAGLALVRSMAVALARHDIRVNALVPGWTATEMIRPAESNQRFVDATVRRTPVRRWAEPEEFAGIACYLCDKSQRFHTGDAVVVDGGYTVF
jgi:NAD(P)-dependent dehydrogenase (short-subunit alcohol dehydrogenase family)